MVADAGATGSIYWGRFRPYGALFVTPKTGGNATQISSLSDAGWLDALAFDGTRLYFSNYSDHDTDASRGLYSLDVDGTHLKQLAGGGHLGTSVVAVNAGYVYVENQYDTLAIARVPVDGGPVEPLLTFQGTGPFYQMQGGIFLDDNWLYYATNDSIWRMAHDGTSNAPIFNIANVLLVGVHDGRLYWRDQAGNVYWGAIDGSDSPVLMFVSDSALVFHDSYVYAQRDTNIVRFKEGVPLATPEFVWFGDAPWPLTTDGVSLIWVEHYKGQVYRLAF